MKIKGNISAKTKIYAILGDPIEHSLSPIIYNNAFRIKGLDKVFIALKTNKKNLKLALDTVRSFNIKGLSITMPLKEEIMNYLNNLSTEAKIIGAVNCVVNKNGVLNGYNTDGKGFSLSLKGKTRDNMNNVFVFGAGGVAKAIIVQLMLENIKNIYITNRHIDRAKLLVKNIKNLGSSNFKIIRWDPEEWGKVINSCNLIVNATSLGMKNIGDLSTMIPWTKIKEHTVIYDTVYEPLETKLLKRAVNLEFKVINGTNLLLYQASIAFNLWTDEELPLNLVQREMLSFLNRKNK